jgi:uncharacterized spore protein YtfJ
MEEMERTETQIQKLLDALADVRQKANVNACFGEPVSAEGHTLIPVAGVAYGFAAGAGRDMMAEEDTEEKMEDTSTGGGGGVMAHPLAVVDVTPEGARVKPIVNEEKLAVAGALLIGWAVFWLARALVKIFKP